MSKKTHLHLWIPELVASKGGVQVFSKFFLQAIHQLYPEIDLSIFLKNDQLTAIRVTDWLEQLIGDRTNNQSPDQSNNQSKTISIHCSGTNPTPWRTIAFSWQLIAKAIAQKPDLIIMTHLNFAPIALLLKWLVGTKYIAIAHGVEAWDIKNPLLLKALKSADLILAVSSFTRDRLCQTQSISSNRVKILPNTFDASAWRIVPKPQHLLDKHKLQPNQKVILTVSRLISSEQYKGYDRILEALPTIRQAIPDVHYIIVGKGDDGDRLEQIIQQKQLQNHVTLAGFIADKSLCDYYNLCDLFAMPSKREGFGIVYLEALACGKPVLGGNIDGAIDALDQGKLGALINPENTEAIAQEIINILTDRHDNKVIYQPQMLREKVINLFGFSKFQATLNIHTKAFLERQ